MNRHRSLVVVGGLLISLLAIPAASAAPSSITDLVVTTASVANTLPTAAAVTVKWTKSVVDGSHSLAIAYSISATATGETTKTATIPAVLTQSSYEASIDGLSGGITYNFSVIALASDSTNSGAVSLEFLTQSVPRAPTVASAVAGPGTVTLNWSAPSNTGGLPLGGYVISSTPALASPMTAIASANSEVVSGLSNGSSYIFQISAKNSLGTSAADIFASVTLPNTPGVSSIPTASVSSTTITANWNDPVSNGGSAITGYRVYLIGSNGLDMSSKTVTGAKTTTFASVAVGTYTLKVVVSNVVGDSVRSGASSPQVVEAAVSLQANNPVMTPSTFSNLAIGNTQSISATTASGGVVTISLSAIPTGVCTFAPGATSAGVVTGVAEGICTVTSTSDRTTTYASGSTSKTFNIVKQSQTITFDTITSKTLPGPLELRAQSSSLLPITYSATGNCTSTGTTVTFTGVGTCLISAAQVGNSSYAAAVSVSRSFSISKQTQAIIFGGIADQTMPGTLGVSATAAPDLSVRFTASGTCSVSANMITFISAGSCSITASQAGNSIYSSATSIIRTFTIAAAAVLIGQSGGSTPAPSATPTTSAKPTPTPTPSPSPSLTPTPTPTPSSKPTPSASPSPIPTLTPTPTPPIVNTFFTSTTKIANVQQVTSHSPISAASTKTKFPVQIITDKLSKGATATTTITLPTGRKLVLPAQKVSATGELKLPSLVFSKPGTYTFSIKIGKITRTITLKVRK